MASNSHCPNQFGFLLAGMLTARTGSDFSAQRCSISFHFAGSTCSLLVSFILYESRIPDQERGHDK